MSANTQFVKMEPGFSVLNLGPLQRALNDEEFYQFCELNKDWRIERTNSGDLIIMPGTGGNTGRRNARLIQILGNWAEQDGTGQFFDSSTIFALSNGARRSPDASWVRTERWNALSELEKERYPPLCPDVVLELRSGTDSLAVLFAKLEEYIANGAQLGWLIDPNDRRVYVYRPGLEVEVLNDPQSVSGEPLLRGFVLTLASIWD